MLNAAVETDVTVWKLWCLVYLQVHHVKHWEIREQEEFCIRTELDKMTFCWSTPSLTAQFLLVIHYSEAVDHFVHIKVSFHQSFLGPGIPGSLSKKHSEETNILIWIFTFLAPLHGTRSTSESLMLSLTVMLCQSDITWHQGCVLLLSERVQHVSY